VSRSQGPFAASPWKNHVRQDLDDNVTLYGKKLELTGHRAKLLATVLMLVQKGTEISRHPC
jgi:hypothetical protein